MKNKRNEKMYGRHYTDYFEEETGHYSLEGSEPLSARPSGKDRAKADKYLTYTDSLLTSWPF